MTRQPDKKTIGFALAAGLAAGGIFAYAIARNRRQRSEKFLDAVRIKPNVERRPKPGDILLFHNAKGSNNITGWLTGSPFYHAGIYAGNNEAVESRPRGVVLDSLSDRANDYIVVPAPDGAGPEALAWAKRQVGDGYDKWDIAIIVLEHIFTRLRLNYAPRNKFTCGEFVATAFDKAGVRLFPERDLADVVPADFARLLPARAIPRH